MLKVNNLVKKYGSLEVLKDISFQVGQGKVFGFLGQNGAGKTTTMNILTGLIGFNSGEIYLNGINLKNNKRELLKKIGYLPQAPVFYGYMNAYEYLKFIGSLSGMSSKEISIRSEEVLKIVKLKEAAKRKLSGYSGGMKQRFGIAVAIFNKPELLFLDEPTSALDPEGRMEVLQLIKKLKNQGITVFLSTHILNDVERVCDDVSIIHHGKIILSKRLEELRNEYIQPIYDIEFERDCSYLKTSLSNISWIEKLIVSNNKASVFVNNIDLAKENMINEINKNYNPILSFNLRKSNLEDVFIRLVKLNE